MQISKNCNFVLKDLFSYDFQACNYYLLKNIGWDLSKINFEDKKQRNIQIGYLQMNNPKLARYLYDSTISLINMYLSENKVDESQVIMRARDGVITSKKFTKLNITMPIEFVSDISKFIISTNRKRYLAIYPTGKVEVKGVSNKTVNTDYFNLFKNLNFSTKKGILNGLDLIRQAILKSENIFWFVRKTEDNNFLVPIIGEGILRLNTSSISMIDINEVDKNFVWEEFIWPFAKSLLVHCYSQGG